MTSRSNVTKHHFNNHTKFDYLLNHFKSDLFIWDSRKTTHSDLVGLSAKLFLIFPERFEPTTLLTVYFWFLCICWLPVVLLGTNVTRETEICFDFFETMQIFPFDDITEWNLRLHLLYPTQECPSFSLGGGDKHRYLKPASIGQFQSREIV